MIEVIAANYKLDFSLVITNQRSCSLDPFISKDSQFSDFKSWAFEFTMSFDGFSHLGRFISYQIAVVTTVDESLEVSSVS